MTPSPRFILDENVVILAQRGLDEYGNPSPICEDLIQRIIDICHTLVVDDVLLVKTFDQLSEMGYHHPQRGPHLISTLSNAFRTAGKVHIVPGNAREFDREESIPVGSQDDTYLVRLAVDTGAILVTTDGALRDDLETCGLISEYGLTVVSPEQALGLL